MPAHEINGGPSDKATAAYMNEPGGRPFPLLAAHQPSLGLDRSVCLRDVYDVLTEAYHPQNPTAAHPADVIEREFGTSDR